MRKLKNIHLLLRRLKDKVKFWKCVPKDAFAQKRASFFKRHLLDTFLFAPVQRRQRIKTLASLKKQTTLVSVGRFLLLFFFFFYTATSFAQYSVKDKKHNKWSRILQQVQTASLVINTRVALVVDNVKKVQEFISKAHSIVRSTVKNAWMVNQTILITSEINELVQKSIETINQARDHNLDGQEDLYYLNKWKHIQILLAIAAQADSVWELFKNVLEDDAQIIDDKGRLRLLKEVYKDALKIKTSIRVQLRRINKEIFAYQGKRREVLAFEKLFGTN